MSDEKTERSWRAAVDAAAMKANVEIVGYMLRLGMANTGIRAASRLKLPWRGSRDHLSP
jgi:hypothetical protein